MTNSDRWNRLETKIDKLQEQIILCREDIAGLKVKAGIWGLLAGALPVLITLGGALVAKLVG